MTRDTALRELSISKTEVARAIARCELRIEQCKLALSDIQAAVDNLGLAEENVRSCNHE